MLRCALKILNEAEYLEAILRQWMPVADSLLIIEGTDSYMRNSTTRVTSDGLSTDGTTQIILNFPDPEGKLEYVPMGFYQEEDESIQRFMNGLKAGDILWTASGDEFFFADDIAKVLKEMEETSCLTLKFPFRTYWHDFYHRLRGGGWDNELARVFRLVENGMEIISKGATLRDHYGRSYDDPFYSGSTKLSDVVDHHFSYVRTIEKIMEKQCWQLRVENNWDSSTKDSPINTGLGGALDCYTLKKRYRTPENYIRRNFSFFTHSYDERYNIYVERFEGPWPEVLADHKYKEELVWDEEPIITKGLNG